MTRWKIRLGWVKLLIIALEVLKMLSTSKHLKNILGTVLLFWRWLIGKIKIRLNVTAWKEQKSIMLNFQFLSLQKVNRKQLSGKVKFEARSFNQRNKTWTKCKFVSSEIFLQQFSFFKVSIFRINALKTFLYLSHPSQYGRFFNTSMSFSKNS